MTQQKDNEHSLLEPLGTRFFHVCYSFISVFSTSSEERFNFNDFNDLQGLGGAENLIRKKYGFLCERAQ